VHEIERKILDSTTPNF